MEPNCRKCNKHLELATDFPILGPSYIKKPSTGARYKCNRCYNLLEVKCVSSWNRLNEGKYCQEKVEEPIAVFPEHK